MEQEQAPKVASKKAVVAGWIMGGLPCLLLFFSAAMKLAGPKEVVEGFEHLGLPASIRVPLGILELFCTVAYLVPRTAMLGAILLTGYLGGAILTHLRVGEPFFTQIVLGMILWGGLFFRDVRIRKLIPIHAKP